MAGLGSSVDGPAAGPPAPDAGRRRPGGARLALHGLAGLLSVAILVSTTGGWLALRHYTSRITHVDLGLGPHDPLRPPAELPGAENFLLVGSDSRAGGEFQAAGAGAVTGERSDTTILAHLAPDGTTTMLSFPRDTWVAIPAYTVGKVRHPAHPDKINAAISLGGPGLLVQTVEALTGVRIDHYLQVHFEGFQAMTTAIGGVDVCIRHSDVVEENPGRGTAIYYPPATNIDDTVGGFRGHDGINHLDGLQSLLFVRQRHGLPGSDLDRIRRQQQFIAAIFKKALSSGTLLNPEKLAPFLSAATGALTADRGTGLTDLRVLASRLRGLSANQVAFATVPTYVPVDNLRAVYHGAAVLRYDPRQLKALLAATGISATAGATASPHATPGPTPARSAAPSAPPELIIPPAQVSVTVLDGSGRAALATRAVTGLRKQGFTASLAGSAAVVARSQVRYGSGRADSADTLAASVPGSVLVRDNSAGSQGLRLVVGAGFSGIVRVTVTPVAAGPQTGAPPTTGPPATSATSSDVTCTY